MRLFLCLLIVLFLSVANSVRSQQTAQTRLISEEKAKEEVDQLLASASTRDRAWAAHFIGRYGLKEYVPKLLDLLTSAPADARGEGVLLSRVALDSLIQLQADVPATDLMPAYKRFPDEVMILLSMSPGANQQALLSIARNTNPHEENVEYWLAACNLLTEIEASGLAAYLLSEVRIDLTVFVTDQPNMGFGGGSGASVGCGGSGGPMPEGFPPIAYYNLSKDARRGGVVTAPGVHPVYFVRTLSTQDPHPAVWPARSHYSWRKADYLPDYLAALVKTTKENLPLRTRNSFTHLWRTRAEYSRMVRIHISEAERGFNESKGLLLERGVLTAAEGDSLAPRIVMTVHDLRRSKAVRLPDMPGVEKSQ